MALVGILAVVVVVAFLAASGVLLPRGVTGVSFGSPAQLTTAGLSQLNASATLGRAYESNDTIWFPASTVTIVFHASPATHDLAFVIQGLVNPTIHVAAGARLGVIVVNEDPDMYHSWALANHGPPFERMPMMGGGVMMQSTMLGPSSGTGFWSQGFSFAADAGQYWYLCTYPGHATDGMYGSLVAD
jgi:rusticyanin